MYKRMLDKTTEPTFEEMLVHTLNNVKKFINAKMGVFK